MAQSAKPPAKSNKGPIVSSRMRKLFSHVPPCTSPIPSLETSSAEYKHTTVLLSPLKAPRKKRRQALATGQQPWEGIATTLLQSSPLHLDDFVVVSILNTSNLGSVKKALHAPSLRMYAIRAVALSNRDARITLVDWFKRWEALQDDNRHMLGIRASYWNQPEGYVSVIVEYADSGSLQSLLDSIGAIPEQNLRVLAQQLIECVRFLHERGIVHGQICPSQVLLTRTGQAKLDIAVKSHLGSKAVVPSIFQPLGKGLETSREEDVYDLGTTLLTCAMGGTEWLDCLQPDVQMSCCLLHTLLASKCAPLLTRLSPQFQALLCACLRFNSKKRARIEELTQDWFQTSLRTGLKVSLRDLFGISFVWVAPSEYQNAAERQLDRICENLKMVLISSSPTIKSRELVAELALDLGLNEDRVTQKLSQVYQLTF